MTAVLVDHLTKSVSIMEVGSKQRGYAVVDWGLDISGGANSPPATHR